MKSKTLSINCCCLLILAFFGTVSHGLNLTGLKGYTHGHSGVELNCNYELEDTGTDETVVEVVWRLNGLAFYVYKFDWANNRRLSGGNQQQNSCGLQVDESKSDDKKVIFNLSPGGPNGNGYYNCEIETRSSSTGASIYKKYHQGAEVTVSVSGKGIQSISLTAGQNSLSPNALTPLLTMGFMSLIACVWM